VARLHLQIERVGVAPAGRMFEAGDIVVGRSEKADIILDDYSVSRRHARLFRRDDGWFVEDLGSRNGTLLNGRAVSGSAPLGAGDIVRIGDTTLRVTALGEKPPTADTTGADATTDQSVFSVLRPASELMQVAGTDARASSRLRLLNEVHRALAAPISREELLQMILDRAFAVLQPEHAAIHLRGADGQLYQAAERRSPRSSGTLLVSRRLADEVTVKGAAALVLDAQSDERFATAASVLASGIRSIVAAPLSDADGCLGMIALYSNIHTRRFSEQDLELLVSLASAATMRIRNIALAEQAAERRVLDRELALAREIQMGMLRRRPPEQAEVELAAHLVPARSVGGDFYDFLIDRDRLWFVVGDVAGKGMAAALFMAVAQTLFRAFTPLGASLAEVVAGMNRELARDNDRAMFVTAFAGCLNLATGRVEIVNAGHILPYWLQADGTVRQLQAASGIALGVVEDRMFPTTNVTLGVGETLLLYTDGVCDAVDARGAAFGNRGLERCLAELGPLPASELVAGVFGAVDAFAGDTAQEDDITVAAIRYRGAPPSGHSPD